jgi:3-oxoacyl-[acyl-carrier protein] reductase
VKQAIVITGASRGIGAAIAGALTHQGFDVFGLSRSRPQAEAQAGAAPHGGSFTWLQADVADLASVESAADRVPGSTALRALVLNAGLGEWAGALEASKASWDEMLGVNLDGAFHAARTFLGGRLALAPDCQVIAIGSDASLVPFANRAAYCASKAALSMFIDCLREEVRPRGIRVTEIRASRVNTGFRNKPIGSRPGSLEPEHVAGLVQTLLQLPPIVELRTMEVSSIQSTFGR